MNSIRTPTFSSRLATAGPATDRTGRRAERVERERERQEADILARERARTARELHDTIAHSVSVMVIQAGAAEQLLDSDPPRAREPLAAVQELAPTWRPMALRPRLIWGVGDNQLLPGLIARANAGRLRIVGDGENLIDSTYIDNASQAHLAAFYHLAPGAPCASRAYFISNGEPRSMNETVNGPLGAVGFPPDHQESLRPGRVRRRRHLRAPWPHVPVERRSHR